MDDFWFWMYCISRLTSRNSSGSPKAPRSTNAEPGVMIFVIVVAFLAIFGFVIICNP